MTDRCDAHCLVGPASHTSDQRDWIADCDHIVQKMNGKVNDE